MTTPSTQHPCPVAAALYTMGLGPSQVLFTDDNSRGVVFLRPPDGRCGLLRWDRPDLHLDQGALGAAIVWGRHSILLPLAEAAEREQGFAGVPGIPLISVNLRAALRAMST